MPTHAYAWEAGDMIRRENEKISRVAICGRGRREFWGRGSLPENVAVVSRDGMPAAGRLPLPGMASEASCELSAVTP